MRGTQPCVPFALAASTVAMLMGVEEEGGQRREVNKKAARDSKYNRNTTSVNPDVLKRSNRWQNMGQKPTEPPSRTENPQQL